MANEKEQQTAVCWRVKASTLEWLRSVARAEDRPVTWVINRMLEQAKDAERAKAVA